MNRQPFPTMPPMACAAMMLFCIGGGVMSAQAAATIPVHDLATELVRADQSVMNLATQGAGFTTDRIVNAQGFDLSDDYASAASMKGVKYWVPNREGAALTVTGIGQWTDQDGVEHSVDATFTVGKDRDGAFAVTSAGTFQWFSAKGGGVFGFTVDFTIDGRPAPDSMRGMTGFTDLDGPRASDTEPMVEGIELVSGFDDAYVRSDAHLIEYGTNGWAGGVDEMSDAIAGAHGLRHYLGCTWTGNHIEVRYTTRVRQYGSFFGALPVTVEYPLTYMLNGGAGTIPNRQ